MGPDPHPSYFRAAPEVFDRRYLAQLDRVGVNRLLQQFQALDDGRPLVFLCFERNVTSGADCHRRLFAEHWLEQTGEIIPEITQASLEIEEAAVTGLIILRLRTETCHTRRRVAGPADPVQQGASRPPDPMDFRYCPTPAPTPRKDVNP